MRFHGRRAGEIPPDILWVSGCAQREVRGDDVVLIILVLRKIIGVMTEMVVVIPAHATGMRSTTGTESRAMRP